MKALLRCTSVVVCIAVLGLTGCDSGSIAEGLPEDADRTVSPEMQKQMQINMSPTKPSEIAKKKKEAEKATKALEPAR